MLARHVFVARTLPAPWDDVRAARVLDRAIEARRTSRPAAPSTFRWVLVFAGASLGAAFVAFRPLPSNGDEPATGEPRPVVSTPSDALDGGKHAG